MRLVLKDFSLIKEQVYLLQLLSRSFFKHISESKPFHILGLMLGSHVMYPHSRCPILGVWNGVVRTTKGAPFSFLGISNIERCQLLSPYMVFSQLWVYLDQGSFSLHSIRFRLMHILCLLTVTPPCYIFYALDVQAKRTCQDILHWLMVQVVVFLDSLLDNFHLMNQLLGLALGPMSSFLT